MHAEACKCVGTIVVPEWTSACFWPLLLNEDGIEFASFVSDWMYLPLSPNLFIKGKRGSCLFKDNLPNTNVLALRLSFIN